MKLVSVNVGLPREVEWRGELVTTGIFKEPVGGRVALRTLNLDGDRQADLTVHGGVNKAVYAYPSEHYEYWRGELPGVGLPWGTFGENFTTEGLAEEAVRVGDRFRVGEAEVLVTQPRLPCRKLEVKFRRGDMIKRFLASRRTGFYFAVLRGGAVGAGDCLELVGRDEHGVSINDLVRAYALGEGDLETMRRAVKVGALPEGWKSRFRQYIEKHGRAGGENHGR